MIQQIGHAIVSALGFSTAENYRAVCDGKSGIARYPSYHRLPEPIAASLIDRERLDDLFASMDSTGQPFTALEKASLYSVYEATKGLDIDLADPRVLFCFSTTKGNIDLLESNNQHPYNQQLYLWHTAQLIASYFGNHNAPVVLSNACISGGNAQIVAQRELESGNYDYAVVTGVDLLSPFIVAGFHCLKALSPLPCRPFDRNRSGLNLGEAAATIIYRPTTAANASGICLVKGAVRNDANHISGPSRTGEGSYQAIQATLKEQDINDIAFVNAHGTATPYNDRMEAIALTRAGLERLPVNSLKGYFGHTLGAAGIVESIISSCALADNRVIASLGFEEGEEEYPLPVARQLIPGEGKQSYLKMLSGFGGCNAVLLTRNYGEKKR